MKRALQRKRKDWDEMYQFDDDLRKRPTDHNLKRLEDFQELAALLGRLPRLFSP